jgi:hypothetical protein
MKTFFLKKITAVFGIVLFFNTLTYGQLKETYAKGSVQLKNGQTISGFIKERELGKMNYSISLKLSEKDKKSTVYDTAQIKTYSLNGNEFFEFFQIKINDTTENISVLAKLVLKGKASLYKFVYKDDVLYIIKNNEKLYVLQNDKLERGSQETEVKEYHFKYHLTNAISDLKESTDKLETIKFNEKDFVAILSAYNSSFGSDSKLMTIKEKNIHYILATIGGMLKKDNQNEFFVQLSYRTYFPKISRSTSLNIGINYYKYNYIEADKNILFGAIGAEKKYVSTLISLPFQIQQNILNKNIRPYIFGGFNAAYYKVIDGRGISKIQKGFQRNFGVSVLGGVGIEIDIFKGLMIKSEFRHEIYTHPILFGIGYNFSKR